MVVETFDGGDGAADELRFDSVFIKIGDDVGVGEKVGGGLVEGGGVGAGELFDDDADDGDDDDGVVADELFDDAECGRGKGEVNNAPAGIIVLRTTLRIL